ncbi:AfsR/SARP family transcriptional regulator [Actinoplanes solisilvae]|uniref:AfsR/SARP family transcriptional regulator n=1 Tax=Actinoplanes solisilvae TaxID=2486853 RepID=UPI000FD90C97|nr:BTAD domain-containing putative transcriptional regulator [Actinoplanes solisilvae]
MTPRFAILGPVEIRTAAEPISVPRAQRRGLLAYLLLNSDRLVTADGIAAALWGPEPPASARSQVHTTVSVLRGHLRTAGSNAELVGRAGGYQLSLGGDELDLVRFEELVSRARTDMRAERWADAADALRSALDLWRGEALADASGAFVAASRLSLHDQRLGAVESSMECRLKLDEYAAVQPELRELVVQHPLHEGFRGQLMRALWRDGRREEALQQFQQLRATLAEQQGLDPGPELAALQKAILVGDPPAPVPTVWRPPAPAQLPPRPRDFVGRTAELRTLDSTPRVAVIVGGAGVGKTALAVHWAADRAAESPDGQLFVDLHGFGQQPALTPHRALERLLRGIGVPADELPADVDERGALYRSLTANRRYLAILDNAEDSDQVRPLLAAGTSRTVVTSRRRLDGLVVHSDATVVSIPPLPEADGRHLLAALTGLDAADPELGRLTALCDQLPLALRIAAARLRPASSIGVGELADALTAEHERLHELAVEDGGVAVRAAFQLSYRALSVPAARLFRLLGQFPGPAPAAGSASALAGADAAEPLAELVTNHLLTETGPDRYALHDLLALYARELSEHDPDAELRLLDRYGTAAAAGERFLRPHMPPVEPELHGPVVEPVVLADADAALDWFDAEASNLIALIGRWTDRHPRACWQLATNLRGWLERRASRTTWIEVMRSALVAAEADGSAAGQADILNSLAIAYSHLRRREEALATYARARAVREQMGDVRGAAVVAMNIGCLKSEIGEVDEAVSTLEDALAVLVGLPGDNAVVIRVTRLNLAYALRRAGAYDRALALNQAVLAQAEAAGDDDVAANTHVNVGALHLLAGDPEAALRHYRIALTMARELRYRVYERWALRGLGDVHRDRKEFAEAAAVLAEAVMLYREDDDPAADEVQAELDSVRALEKP